MSNEPQCLAWAMRSSSVFSDAVVALPGILEPIADSCKRVKASRHIPCLPTNLRPFIPVAAMLIRQF